LRRVVPQKVQPAADQSYFGESADINKPGAPGVARRARTSAAMIGLAISMGASGLLLPRHDGRAVAAEPQSAEAESAPVPGESSGDLPAASALTSEVVRPGRRLASQENADAAIRSFNRNSSVSDVLEKEQVPSIEGSIEQMRLERESSLDRLRRQRSQLQESLSGLRVSPESIDNPESVAPKAIAPDTVPEVLSPEVEGTELYRVKPGDTLASIAQAHGVSSQTLIALNNLQNPNFLRVHQLLRVPQTVPDVQSARGLTGLTNLAAVAEPEVQAPQASRPEVSVPSTARATHRVAFGETVAAIARSYGISQADLIAENRLSNPNFIRVGQTLQIPVSASVEQSTSFPLASASLPEVPETLAKDVVVEAPAREMATIPPGAMDLMPRPEPIITSSSAVFSTEFIAVESEPAEVSEVVPPVEVAQESVVPAVGGRNLYTSQLMNQVSDLQSRFSGESVEAAVEVEEPALIAASNLEESSEAIASLTTQQFAAVAAPGTLSSQELQERAVEPKADAFADGIVEVPEEPQMVAAAPIGSENYAPLLEPVVGRMVSPELPPLPAADAFLPEGSNTFAGYAWPARGVLTSGYGPRWGRMHRGIDIAAPVGTPIYAAAPGVVEFAGWNSGGYGYMVDIRHPDGSMTRYAHNSRLLVQRGQDVAQGEQISEMGSTGYSTGPHLHFEIHLPERGAVNPVTMLASR